MSEPVKKPAGSLPAVPPESYTPKELPEIMKLAGEINMNKPYEVKPANGGSYIDGIPPLKWGEFKDCCYSGCVSLWLNVMGHSATYEQAAGLTGSCYRLSMCYGWDPGSTTLNTSYAYLRGFKNACGTDGNANRAFGFEFHNVKDEAERDEQVRMSIDAGIPVLALGSRGDPEWCVITGYDRAQDGFRYFGRSYWDADASESEERFTDNEYLLANNYPGEHPDIFLKLGDTACKPTSPRDALRRSLEACLRLFGRPKKRAHKRMGYGAYKYMIKSLNKNENTDGYSGANAGLHFSILLDARRAAYIYLEESAALLAGENKAKLLRVSAMYREMFDALSAVLPYEQCRNWQKPELTAELRQALITALRKMLSLEKQARVLVKEILKRWDE